MTAATAKARAMEALLTGPLPAEKVEGAAVYLLKAEGIPVVTRKDGGRLSHHLVETDLQPAQVRAARNKGLAQALRWHRREPVKAWADLIEGIACPFERDSAADYLRGIIDRMKALTRLGGH